MHETGRQLTFKVRVVVVCMHLKLMNNEFQIKGALKLKAFADDAVTNFALSNIVSYFRETLELEILKIAETTLLVLVYLYFITSK